MYDGCGSNEESIDIFEGPINRTAAGFFKSLSEVELEGCKRYLALRILINGF